MAQMNRRAARRQRYLKKGNPGGGAEGGGQRQFATAGEERGTLKNTDASRDPKTLSDFDPAYGKTHSAQAQPRGGQAPYERESYGNQGAGEGSNHGAEMESGHGGGESGFGKTYGEGFGVGAGRGVESSSSGLEGAGGRERDYRGNAGTTFGAVVGPDALKEDTREDERRRPDPKPEERE